MNLYLLQYNNYYNRLFKKEETLNDYLPHLVQGVMSNNPLTNINFIPNDGVNTEQVINWDGGNPDYLVVVDEFQNINSRWFIVESVRLRSGQFKLSLHRDLIADFWNDITQAPMFVEKGYCSIDDNFIFNDEQITTNQIKDREVLLKDATGMPWIVGYCAVKDDEETEPTRIEYGLSTDTYDYYTPTLADWDFWPYVSNQQKATIKFPKNINYEFVCVSDAAQVPKYTSKFNKNGRISYNKENIGSNSPGYMSRTGRDPELIYQTIDNTTQNMLYAATLSSFGITDDPDLYRELQQFAVKGNKAKRLKVGDGVNAKYYTINLVANPQSQTNKTPTVNDTMYLAWVAWCKGINTKYGKTNPPLISSTYATASFITNILTDNFYIELIPSTPYSSLDFYFPWGRKTLTDAPYCMFAIPYGEFEVYYNDNGTKQFKTCKENALSVAAGLATSLDAKLYDIQLLPYCPIPLIRNSEYPTETDFTRAPFNNWTINEHYVIIESARQVMFFCEQSSDSFNIPVGHLGLMKSDAYFTPMFYKKYCLTESLRLCSPNYNGVFEFNPYKNRGLDYINVDYTYKPYQPYIHLNPNFGGLYGKDFDDARGLICGGDFSLPITQDAWKTYQTQNKTYQEQFNRQIENMEVQNKWGRIQDKVSATIGTLQAGISGAGTGYFLGGGGIGAGVGAAAGTMLSGAAGIADVYINEQLRNEAMDYTKDMFGLQLENIKALPNSLTRVSSFNANNKIFPFLELYTCSDEELAAVEYKLTYNGFTLGRIDTLENTINNKPLYMANEYGYFKGQIIRLSNIGDDSHIANSIAAELYKGVYV